MNELQIIQQQDLQVLDVADAANALQMQASAQSFGYFTREMWEKTKLMKVQFRGFYLGEMALPVFVKKEGQSDEAEEFEAKNNKFFKGVFVTVAKDGTIRPFDLQAGESTDEVVEVEFYCMQTCIMKRCNGFRQGQAVLIEYIGSISVGQKVIMDFKIQKLK
jgi:hypothetical protein